MSDGSRARGAQMGMPRICVSRWPKTAGASQRPKLTAKDEDPDDEARQPGQDEGVGPEVRAADSGILRSNQARAEVLRRHRPRHVLV